MIHALITIGLVGIGLYVVVIVGSGLLIVLGSILKAIPHILSLSRSYQAMNKVREEMRML